MNPPETSTSCKQRSDCNTSLTTVSQGLFWHLFFSSFDVIVICKLETRKEEGRKRILMNCGNINVQLFTMDNKSLLFPFINAPAWHLCYILKQIVF